MAERSRLSQLPGRHLYQVPLALVALGTAKDMVAFINNFGAPIIIKAVSLVPQAAKTGNDTNNFTLQLRNKELGGAGAVAVTAVKTYDTGTDLVAFDEDALVVSTTAANLRVEDGEVLALNKGETGSGLEMPDLVLSIEFEFTS